VQGAESKGATRDLKLLLTNASRLTESSSRWSPPGATAVSVVVVGFYRANMCACCPHLTRLGKGCHLCSLSYGIVLCRHLVCQLGLRVVGAACDWQYQERHESSDWLLTGLATTAWRTTPKNCGWRFSDAWGMVYPRRRPWWRLISSERERWSRFTARSGRLKDISKTPVLLNNWPLGLWSLPIHGPRRLTFPRTLTRFSAKLQPSRLMFTPV